MTYNTECVCIWRHCAAKRASMSTSPYARSSGWGGHRGTLAQHKLHRKEEGASCPRIITWCADACSTSRDPPARENAGKEFDSQRLHRGSGKGVKLASSNRGRASLQNIFLSLLVMNQFEKFLQPNDLYWTRNNFQGITKICYVAWWGPFKDSFSCVSFTRCGNRRKRILTWYTLCSFIYSFVSYLPIAHNFTNFITA